MSGDYSRWSFDPQRHFGAVLMQQGRVQTDADWNEWVTTALRRVQAGDLDTLGRAVVPTETPDGFAITAAAGKLTIGRGRMYVDGLLVENHGGAPMRFDPRLAELHGTTATPYEAQPHLPDPPALAPGGPHLVYLKAWQREVTAVEAPDLIEPALGVDTTTRLQTVWQVRVLADVGAGVTCATPLADVPGFSTAEPAAAGRLTVTTADVGGQPDPCRVPPGGAYRGLENQLYRIEVHAAGGVTGAKRASFKWSRDNATVASRVTEIPALDAIVVDSLGRDEVLGFSDGDWVEVTDDRRELSGLPGELRRIQTGGGVEEATHTIRLTAPLPAGAFPVDAAGRTAPARNTRVRRWDQHGRVVDDAGALVVDLDAAGADGTIEVPAGGGRVLLEHGIVVSFTLDPGSGRLRTGDHWLTSARATDASVEALDAAPPRGIHAHYARLALVGLPDAETDCRTHWPPPGGDGGCDCTVCVSPESHASGAMTVQAAIDQVKASGGTVCLAAGRYPVAKPVEVHDARSVRLRGQGLASVLVATDGAGVLDVRRSIGVTIEDLAAVASSAQTDADAIRLERCLDVRLARCAVIDRPGDAGRGAAVRLAGYLVGASVQDCVLAADSGIAGGTRTKADDALLATASLRVDGNWLWCARRGVDLGEGAVHVADTRIAHNTIWGCGEVGVLLAGAAGGPVDVVANALRVDGSGIGLGVDSGRVADNDIRGGGGDGVALLRGLDKDGIDHCLVLANRITGMGGHGIAIRAHLASAMVKHNVLAELAGGGIVMEDDGSAAVLVIENNQLIDVAMGKDVPDVHLSALRCVAVEELEVAGNTLDGVAEGARQAASRTAILTVASAAIRIAANRLVRVGPSAETLGRSAAIEVVMPFGRAAVTDNTARRPAPTGDRLGAGAWSAIRVGDGGADLDAEPLRLVALSDLGLALAGKRTVLLTATTARAIAGLRAGDVDVRGNEVVADASTARPVHVGAARLFRLTDNRLAGSGGRTPASLARCERAIVAGNDLRARGDEDVLELEFARRPEATVLGNLHTGRILLDGNPLGDPWAPLNTQSQD